METLLQDENAISRMKMGKMGPPVAPVLRGRPLADVNKNQSSGKLSALQRQRENANKLMSGKSVVHPHNVSLSKSVANKENIPKGKSVLSSHNGTLPKKKSGLIKKPTLSRTDSVVTLYQPQKNVVPVESTVQQLCQHLDKVKLEAEPGVIDIDEKDAGDPFYLSNIAKEVYLYLKQLEVRQSVRQNYLTSEHIMTKSMRAVLVDWMFEVQSQFRLLGSTIQMAISILDRYMQDHPHTSKLELQLVGTACIWLASKYEEIYPPDVADMEFLSANSYTINQIKKMERNVIAALDFQLGRPTPSQFLRRYARVANMTKTQYTFSKYFVDLALVNYSICHVPPSLLAASAIYLSLFLFSGTNPEDIWTVSLKYFSGYTLPKLKPVVAQLAKIILDAPSSNLQTVRVRYADVKNFYAVSCNPELKSERLKRLAEDNFTSDKKF